MLLTNPVSSLLPGLSDEEVDKRVDEALKAVDLLDYKEYSPFHLSFGQRKRVAIAGVLAMDPPIIALDEPFANLDYPTQKSLQTILEKDVIKKGKTLIFTSHSRQLIQEWSDKMLFLDKGEIVYFGPSSNLSQVENIDEYLGPYH